MTGVGRYAAVLGIGLLTCLSACDSSGSSVSDSSPSSPPAAIGELVVADAARATSRASPLRVRIAYVPNPGVEESLRMEGVVDWETSRAVVEEWVDPGLLGITPSPDPEGIRLVGRIYVDAQRAVEVGVNPDGTTEAPEQVTGTAASLAGLEDDPEPDAAVTVDGRDLILYEGRAKDEDVADLDVWLDADGLIAQMVRHTDVEMFEGRMVVVFSDFGTDAPIAPPPELSPTAGTPSAQP